MGRLTEGRAWLDVVVNVRCPNHARWDHVGARDNCPSARIARRDVKRRAGLDHSEAETGRTAAGSRMVNVLPAPGVLTTETSPPIMRQNSRVRARPKPVPPYRAWVSTSAWENA